MQGGSPQESRETVSGLYMNQCIACCECMVYIQDVVLQDLRRSWAWRLAICRAASVASSASPSPSWAAPASSSWTNPPAAWTRTLAGADLLLTAVTSCTSILILTLIQAPTLILTLISILFLIPTSIKP